MRRFTPPLLIALAATTTLASARIFIAPGKFDWPSWVQAVGAIAAILVAAWIPFLQREDAVAAENAKIARRRVEFACQFVTS
jgi:hypothetical protein